MRIVRSILGSTIEVDGSDARVPEVRASLVDLLLRLGRDLAPRPRWSRFAAGLRRRAG